MLLFSTTGDVMSGKTGSEFEPFHFPSIPKINRISSRFPNLLNRNPIHLQNMPFCTVSDDVKIFYRTYATGSIKVLLIIGLAGTHDSWSPQIVGLTGSKTPNEIDDDDDGYVESTAGDYGCRNFEGLDGIQVCAFDNRGMGRSSVPSHKSQYTTSIMANDALALMDHLGWRKAHVFGHSMGGMIACKLASMAPDRILSLALLNVTGGGFECFPKIDRKTVSIALRFLRAKTPEQRAAVDLDTHYTEEYLEESVGSNTRREILYQQYVKGISATGMQSTYGFDGQINACWTHRLTSRDIESIRAAGFLISVIHGRYDVIAQMCYARRLAMKLQPYCRIVELHGGHLVSHERTDEVNKALVDLIKASETKLSPHDWTNLHTESSGDESSMIVYMLAKIHLAVLFLFSLFVLALGYARKAVKSLKPIRVEPTLMHASNEGSF